MTYDIKTANDTEVALDLGKPLYIADTKTNKVHRFKPDCIKLFKDNLTVHGFEEQGRFSLPCEYSLKHLNVRIIFTKRKDAENWLAERNKPKEKEA